MLEIYPVGVTQPLIPQCKNAEELVSYCARVSNPSNQANHKTASGLLKYLYKHEHWSPFEMVHLTVGIETTRDIARQILRHRSFSFQEFSQRYANSVDELGFVFREARLQDEKNRQNSIEIDDEELKKLWIVKQQQIVHECELAYKWAIDNNIAKEQARAVLPEGNTISKMYMAGSLRSWIHYCALRSGNGTQKEHREVAKRVWNEIISEHFPAIVGIAD